MENVKGRVPLKKVVSIVPNEGSRFCLVNGQTPLEVNQRSTASTSSRPLSSGSIRSISPAQRWPVRSKSQDRHFLRRSLIFEEGGSKVTPENGVTHIPKLPFTRPRESSQSSGCEGGAKENGTGFHRSARSPVRNDFSSRSSMSSRESSQESLDHSSSRGLSPSRGRSRQFRSRKAKSISQKAKIWEAVAKTDKSQAAFSTLPWSTKFVRNHNLNNGRPESSPRLMKTCSSPSLTDMMAQRDATNADELMARDIVDYYNREIQPSAISESSGSKSKRKLKRASTSSIDGSSLRKRSLTPLDEEEQFQTQSQSQPQAQSGQSSPQCPSGDDVPLVPVIENSNSRCDREEAVKLPQAPPQSPNVITFSGPIGPLLTEVEPNDTVHAVKSSPLAKKIDMQRGHLEDQTPDGTKELTPVRLVTRPNAFDKNSSAKQEVRLIDDDGVEFDAPTSWKHKAVMERPTEINGVNPQTQVEPVRAIFLTSNLEFDEEERMGGNKSPAFPGGESSSKSNEGHITFRSGHHHSGFAKSNISPLAEENEHEEQVEDEPEKRDNEAVQVSEKKTARSRSVGETQRPQIVSVETRPEVTIKRETKVVVEFPDENKQDHDVIGNQTIDTPSSSANEGITSHSGNFLSLGTASTKPRENPKRVEIEEVLSDSDCANEESLFSADITPDNARVQINDDDDLPNASVPNFLVIQELESDGISVNEVEEKSPEKVKCDIRIEITLCDDPDNPIDPMLDEDCEAPTRSTTPEHFEVSEDDEEDDDDDEDADDDSIDFTASQTNILDKDEDDFLRDEDLELVTLSNPASSDESEDEFEALRLQRLKESGRREAPERDISEDDTETAEFQLRLRKLSNTSAPSLGSNVAHETEIKRARSVEEVDFEEGEDFFERLRGNRDLERRTSEVPEREIEQEDSETAELQTTLRRSKSNEIFIRRKKSRGSLNPAKRSSLGLEILVEQAPKEESPPEEAPPEEAPDQLTQTVTHSSVISDQIETLERSESQIQEDKDSVQDDRPAVNCLFKSLSAGSDLDKLREISMQKGCIQSLVNLSLLNHTNASKALSPPSQRRAVCNASPVTASILSINKLAESVENLKEKLVSHPGLFFPPPKSHISSRQTSNEMSTDSRTGSALNPPSGGPDSQENSSSPARQRQKTPLSRSHSWQGFGSKEVVRQIRQQAFYDSGRYEQVNASDLDLPPPPSAPPVNLERGRSSQVSIIKRGGKGANKKAARRYRPLSHSPMRNQSGAGPRIAEEELESEPNRVPSQPSSCSRAQESGQQTGGNVSISAVTSSSSSSSFSSPSFKSSQSNSLGRPGSITRNQGNKWKKGGKRDHNLKKSDTAEKEQWSASDEESDNEEELNYQCVVTCSLKSSQKVLSQQAEKNFIQFSHRMEELRCQIVQARPELSPEQVHHILATVTQLHDQKQRDHEGTGTGTGSGSPLPSDEELQDFLNYIGNGILNQERLEYDERRKREREGPEGEEDEEESDQSIKRNKSANQYFYRQHYLSIIQEEEEAGDTPTSSRPNSRPPSACGLPKGNNLRKALKDLKDFSQSESIKEHRENNSYQSKTRAKKHDSWGSEMSEDSLISVNSILSDENNSPNLSDSAPPEKTSPQALNEFLDEVPPPPARFQNVDLAHSSPQLVRTSSSSSNSTMADSRCSSAFSSDLIKDLPHDDVPETVTDLSSPLVKTVPNQSRRKPERQRIAQSSSSMGNKSLFHLTSVKEKLKNAIHQGKETNEHDPGTAKPSLQDQAPTTPTSKVGRFFRSLSRKSSTEDSETDDRKRNSLTSKEEDKTSRRGSNSSITEKTFEKVRMIATKKDFFTSGNHDAEVNHLSSSAVPSVCCASDSFQQQHQYQQPEHLLFPSTPTNQLPRLLVRTNTPFADPKPSDRGNNELSHPSGVVPTISIGLQKDVPQIQQFAGAASPKVEQCQEQPQECVSNKTLSLEDMYQKIDKTQKRSVSSKPTTALDVSITDLITECEDYVKTEEFTKDLSVKILEMFQNERNKFKSNGESVYSVIRTKSEPIYSNVPQLIDHYSEVDKSNPTSIGVPRLRLGSPHNNFCVLEPHYSKPVDHQNIYEQIDQFNQSPSSPQRPEKMVPMIPIKSTPELEPKFPCTRESIYENEEASYQDLPSIITHEASPMDSLPSENSSSAHDSAYESENKPIKETREIPKRPTFPGSDYENFSDSCARVPPVPVPPQFQDESPTTNQFELDEPCSTMKRNPHFTPPKVPIRDSSRRFAGQARFVSLPRSLDSLSSSHQVESSDLDQTCLGETDVVNPISLVFEDLNEYLSDSDGMLSLDYKIAVQKRRNRLRNLAKKQYLSGNTNEALIQDQTLSHGTKTVENFADNEPIIKMGPSQQLVADNTRHNSPSRVKKVVEQIQRKYPQGPAKPVERSRSRRSPSVASECSTLEPIPEEIPGQVYAARVTKPLSIPSPKFYSLPRGAKGFQSNLDDVKENVTDQGHAAIFDTLIQSRRTESPSRFTEFPNGSLKQRKALKTASLTSLLIKDDNKSHREPPTFSSSFQENPLAKCSSFQELSNIFGSTQSLVPLTPRRLDPMAKNLQTKKWVSEVNLGMRAWTPNQVVIKECSCGNKVQFDPMEECSTLGYPTDSETNLEMSDYGSFDRRNGFFFAKPAETVNGSDDDDPTQGDLTPPPAPAPPPRPPPPVLLFNRLGSLKRSQSLNMSQSQRHLQGWNSIPTLSQS